MHSAMFQLMLDYGLRISEVVRLKEKDVDMLNRKIVIERSKKKKDKIGIYKLTDECYKKLRTWLKEWRRKEVVEAGNPYLFISQKTRGVNEHMRTWNVQHWFRKYSKQARIDKTNPHSLRHTLCVKLASAGLSAIDIKERVGHASVITGEYYTKMFGKEKDAQDDRCENALRNSS